MIKMLTKISAKSVLNAYDYGGPRGCHGKIEVVIKISHNRELFENEQSVYTWLATAKAKAYPSDTPYLYFAGRYDPCALFYGLVLSKLGPDLETLRLKCQHKRFTPRMTLAVAIQTVYIDLSLCCILTYFSHFSPFGLASTKGFKPGQTRKTTSSTGKSPVGNAVARFLLLLYYIYITLVIVSNLVL